MASRALQGPASALAAKYTGHGANLRIEQRRDHVTQVIGSNFNVAVAGDQNVMCRDFGQAMEAIVWRIRPGRLPGYKDPAWDVGVARANFPDDGQRERRRVRRRRTGFRIRHSSGERSSRYSLSSELHCHARVLERRPAAFSPANLHRLFDPDRQCAGIRSNSKKGKNQKQSSKRWSRITATPKIMYAINKLCSSKPWAVETRQEWPSLRLQDGLHRSSKAAVVILAERGRETSGG